MHLALVCPELHGHMNPMTTLGRELARRGHRVSLVATPEGKARAGRCGFGWLPVGVPEHESGEQAAAQLRLAELQGLAALRLTGRILADMAAVTLRDAPAAMTAAGVEAVLVDQVSPAGAAVADALGLPFAVVCNALALHQEPAVPPPVLGWAYRPGPLARLRNRLGHSALNLAARPVRLRVNGFRKVHRLPPYRPNQQHGYGLAQVAQQPAAFDFPRADLPPHFHYTGPWHGPDRHTETDHAFPWDRRDGRPLVYASLGTLQNRLKHVFAAILEGCSTLDVQLVLSLGRPDSAWAGPVPANAVVVPFAPQLAVLDACAAVITHAGLNTALEGLARGRPMLCIPVTNDQPGVARRVEWLGAGEILTPNCVTPARIRDAVRRLLEDPKYRAAAGRCRDAIAAGPGVGRAADVAEEAFRTRAPVSR